MATSGVTTNQLTRNQFIEGAMRKLGVLALDQTPSATEYTNGQLALNGLIGTLRVDGLNIWSRTSYTFTPTSGTSSYNIGSGQTFNTPYPIHILQAYRVDSTGSSRIPLDIVADYNFNLLPSNSSGTPIQMTYQPKVNFGTIKLWPTPDSSTSPTITIVYTRPLEYFSSSTDTADLPEEWVLPIIYGLAVILAPEYGLPLEDRSKLEKEYEKFLDIAKGNGQEDGSLFFQVEQR